MIDHDNQYNIKNVIFMEEITETPNTSKCTPDQAYYRQYRRRLRDRTVVRERVRVNRKMRNDSYIEFLKEEHGILDDKDVILDKDFLNDIIQEIEKNRLRKIVYTTEFKQEFLREWLVQKKRKDRYRKFIRKLKEHKKQTK